MNIYATGVHIYAARDKTLGFFAVGFYHAAGKKEKTPTARRQQGLLPHRLGPSE
jgi:hypothetical protein